MKNKTIQHVASLVMALVMILGNTIHTQAAPIVAQTAGPTIYWGAMVDGKVPSTTNLSGVFATFETRSRKRMSIIHWGQPWMMGDGSWGEFQTTYFTNVRNHGSIPMINWTSWRLGGGANQPNFQLRDVYNGNYDTYIRRWATGAKNWGHPFFLRFNHEGNGWWYPWGEGRTSSGTIVNGNSAGDYARAWRHVHDIFVSVGANNVTWLWAPNHIGSSSQYPALSTLYPGDAYVNWTGFSVYNKYNTWAGLNPLLTGSGGMTWYKNSYNLMLTVAPNKPMMLAEFASVEAGDGGAKKAAWIRDALITQIPTNFPKIKAVVWMNWDVNAGKTYPVQSSQAATDAWATGIGSTKYASNQFANLNTTTVLALTGASSALADSSAGESADPSALPAEPTATAPALPTGTATSIPASPTEPAATLPASPTGTATPSEATPTTEPTLSASSTEASANLPAIADSYIDSANPDLVSGGTNTTLYVDADPVQKTFLKFDLTSLTGKTISSVKLIFKTTPEPSAGSVDSMNIKLIGDAQWKEQYLSYSNPVALSNTLLGTVPSNSTPDTWYEIPLPPSSIQPSAGGLLSVVIESNSSDELLLYSREATDKPQLVITYK